MCVCALQVVFIAALLPLCVALRLAIGVASCQWRRPRRMLPAGRCGVSGAARGQRARRWAAGASLQEPASDTEPHWLAATEWEAAPAARVRAGPRGRRGDSGPARDCGRPPPAVTRLPLPRPSLSWRPRCQCRWLRGHRGRLPSRSLRLGAGPWQVPRQARPSSLLGKKRGVWTSEGPGH